MTRLVSMGTLGSAALHGGVAALLLTQSPFSQTQTQEKRAVPIGLTFVAAHQAQATVSQIDAQAPVVQKKTQPLKDRREIRKKTAIQPHPVPSPVQQTASYTQGVGVAAAAPKILFAPKPHYPEEAKRQGQAGVAHVGVKVSAQGHVEEVRLVKTSGSPLLDESALEAVSRWRFMAGGTTPLHAVVPVRFTLTPKV